MLKKIGMSVAIILASSTAAFADPMLPYFGGEIGFDTGKWRFTDITGVKTTFNSNGGIGGLFGGLSWSLGQNFGVNTEIFGNYSSTSTSTQQINVTGGGTSQDNLRMKYSYGASLLPGFKFYNGSMIYLRAGFIRSLFELHQTVPPATATSKWGYKNVGGAQFGVGAEAALGNLANWGIRGEYDYVTYNSFSVFSNTVSARDNQFKIGVLYNFY